MKSKFYRVYVDGEKSNILLNCNTISDAFCLMRDCLDGYTSSVRIVEAPESTITVEEIRSCAVYFIQKGDL